MHLMDLAAEVKAGVQDAGMVAFRFNTIGVSDGISMGTEGMSFSLQSRDLIADSIETVMGGQWYDGNISLPGCDKNMPGVLIAMGRLNRPSIMVYGGSIKPGYSKDNEPLDIVSAFQSYGKSHYCLCTAEFCWRHVGLSTGKSSTDVDNLVRHPRHEAICLLHVCLVLHMLNKVLDAHFAAPSLAVAGCPLFPLFT